MKVTHQRVTADPTTPELGRLYYVQTTGGYRLKVTRNNGTIADMDAPTLAQHALKEDKITAGLATDYWAGDKTFKPLTKASVGLGNVANLAPADLGISDDTQDALDLKINLSEKGQPDGVATLDSNGLIPTGQLPSFVDDVLEGTYISGTVFNDPLGNPYTPESGKIYIHTATTPNQQYRWSGSAYIKISSGDVSEMANFFVRYDATQTLTTAQKTTARNNIGAITLTEVDNAYLPLTAGNNKPLTGVLTVEHNSEGAGRDLIVLRPVAVALGKPRFAIAKTAIDTKYNISLWDGSSSTGTINFISSSLTWNDKQIADTTFTAANYAPLSHVGSGGTSHALATTTVAGFMSAADKTKLDSYSATDNHWVETSAW